MENNNYCVIMGGGIGSRFWPFSRVSKPKQFLDFFGTGRSLLQQTFDRFSKIIPVENIFIVTNELYTDLIREQLPELNSNQILLEPQRRNTAPCIAFASYHIRAVNPDANIVVAPSDHLILRENEFLLAVKTGLDFVENNNTLLTLGIKPNRPETAYGYIQADNNDNVIFKKVKTFTEKPNVELARVFYESGEFYWNSGIFLWNVNQIIDAFHLYLPEVASIFDAGKNIFNTPDEKAFINENFSASPNISIDYGIMEKAPNVHVLCTDVGWSDLGTWGALYDISEKDENNNATLKSNAMYYGSSNNIVTLSNSEKLAVIQDLDGYIVAESNNVLLICKKEDEQRIRQYVIDAQINYGDEYV
ncbi:MAG: mannose-1-phosphate guanylyltransferase [Candidatus Azobacteroides sp.]|nr:mannose-1-phosphate guanylyltransferase [Candidatus Azobacteroides sp.]